MRHDHPTGRGVSTQLSHVFGVAMTAVLITVILTGAATHVQDQRSSVVETQLETIGNRLASEIERIDTLGQHGGSVSVETRVQPEVSGQNYDVQLAEGGACDTSNFHTDSCLVLEANGMSVTRKVPLNVSNTMRLESEGGGVYLLSVAGGASEEQTQAKVERPLRIGVGKSFNVNPVGDVVSGANRPPIGRFRFTPSVPRTGVEIRFSATRSFDADGEIADYLWDFDGDGLFEATGENVTRELDPGPQRVRLQVVDKEGASTNVTRTLRVSGIAYEADLSSTEDASGTDAALNLTVTNYYSSGVDTSVEIEEILIDPKDPALDELDNGCYNDETCPFGDSSNSGEIVVDDGDTGTDQSSMNVDRSIPDDGIIVELEEPVRLSEDESAEVWIGAFEGVADLDDAEFELGVRAEVDGQTNSTVFTDVVGSPNVEEFWIRTSGGASGDQIDGMIVADRKLGHVEVELGGDLNGTASSSNMEIHRQPSPPGEYVYALPLGDLDRGIVKANLTEAEGTEGVPAFETRGSKSLNRSVVLLDGDYVWSNESDWDAANVTLGVVHDSVGVRQPNEVRLGYPPSDQAASNLAGYWPLDEDADDASGTGNHASERGSPSRGIGIYGTRAYVFDGEEDYLEVADDPSLEMSDTDEVTVSMWVNKDTDQSGWIALFQHSDRSYNLHLDEGNFPTFTIYDDDWRGARDNRELETDRWYHVAGTFDGDTVKIYVDGRLVDTTSADYIRDADMDVGMGENLEATGRHFDGKIDEVRVYDRALFGSEIEYLSEHSGRIETGWKWGSQPLGSNATLQYVADVPSGTTMNATVYADTDGDGKWDAKSSRIDLENGQRSASVDGFGNTTATRFKIEVRFSSVSPIKTPVLEQIGLRAPA